jgi:hypothetical protein
MHWGTYEVFSVLSGITLLAAAFVPDLGSRDRLWAAVFGILAIGYGFYVANQQYGTWTFPVQIFIVPFVGVIYFGMAIYQRKQAAARPAVGDQGRAPGHPKPDPVPASRPPAQGQVPPPSTRPGAPVRLSKDGAAAPGAAASAPGAPGRQRQGGSFCPGCGKGVLPGDAFCGSCGTGVGSRDRFCDSSGCPLYMSPANAAQCPSCGRTTVARTSPALG